MDLDIVTGILISNWHIILLSFLIAMAYSSVGFGGGSSYLAVLALTGIAFTQIRSIALLCNIVVVIGNVYLFQKHKLLHWKKVLPLILFSVPFAFLGGYLKISQTFFFILLGCTLLVASISMWVSKRRIPKEGTTNSLSITKNAGYGGFIGFISGMVGIGGGIFLAPLLHLTQWDIPKRIAATTSVFILVNSISGLLGQYYNPDFSIDWTLTTLLLMTVFIGGQLGSRISNRYFTPIQLKKATAILIAIVSIKILFEYVF